MSGMELPLAVMMTIPEPWANNDTISQTREETSISIMQQ